MRIVFVGVLNHITLVRAITHGLGLNLVGPDTGEPSESSERSSVQQLPTGMINKHKGNKRTRGFEVIVSF